MTSSWNRPRRPWVWWVVIVCLLGILVVPSARSFFQGGAVRVGTSIASFVQWARPSDSSSQASVDERWRERLAGFVVDQARLKSLEEENQLLRQQAHVVATSGFETIGAQVLSRSMTPDRAVIFIDRGQSDALEIGQAVLAGDGMFIGKVASLSSHSATVELVTDPRSRVAATLSGETKLLGVVEGRGNGAARMTYIPASQAIKKDQIIVTSGTEAKIPPHLPLGLVNAVEGKNTDPFVSAILEPLVSFDRLSIVTVLRPRASRSL